MRDRVRRDTLEGSWEWLEFAAQLPSKAVPFNSQSGNFAPIGGRLIVTGLSWNNAATTAGTIAICDGVDAAGASIWQAPAAASSIGSAQIPPNGVLCEIGVFLKVTAATISGALLVIPLWHYDWTPPGE